MRDSFASYNKSKLRKISRSRGFVRRNISKFISDSNKFRYRICARSSDCHIYVQIIDDSIGCTVGSSSTVSSVHSKIDVEDDAFNAYKKEKNDINISDSDNKFNEALKINMKIAEFIGERAAKSALNKIIEKKDNLQDDLCILAFFDKGISSYGGIIASVATGIRNAKYDCDGKYAKFIF